MVVHSYIIVRVGGFSQSFPNDRRGGVGDGLWTTALLSHQSAAWLTNGVKKRPG